MKDFSLLIKPTSADCNLRCNYCFYLDKSSLYPETKIHRMDDNTLEALISSYMNTPQTCYSFGWQGGEPTLMGLDFFQRVVKLQKKYGKMGSLVSNGLQTNGLLVDNDFARFMSRHKFLAGLSLDGPQYIHDHYRKTAGGRGSFNDVIKAASILKENDVEFNIIVLVNDFNVDRAAEVYDFLVDKGFYYHQYIPCVEFNHRGKLLPYSINGEKWGQFLIELFKRWYPGDIHKVSIRLFDSIVNYLLERTPGVCYMDNNCCQYLVVEYNGDIYPCDFFVREDLRLGNIKENSLEKLIYSPVYSDFGKKKSSHSFLCSSCQYLDLCHGDCLKYRNYISGTSKNLSILCSGWKMFYKYSIDIFKHIINNMVNI